MAPPIVGDGTDSRKEYFLIGRGCKVIVGFHDIAAIDVDVIKTYAQMGLGVAIVPSVAFETARDQKLGVRATGALFAPTVTQIELRRGNYLRSYMVEFIGTIKPAGNRAAIDNALRSSGVDP